MKQKTAISLVACFCALLFTGCGDDGRGSLPSTCETNENGSSPADSVSQSVSSPDSSEVSSAPEYSWDTSDPEKKIIPIYHDETITLSDGRVLRWGMLLPDGRYFSKEELEQHHYDSHCDYVLPDGTVLYGEKLVRLMSLESGLSKEEWEELEKQNFPEEERWKIAPWVEISPKTAHGIEWMPEDSIGGKDVDRSRSGFPRGKDSAMATLEPSAEEEPQAAWAGQRWI